MAENYVKRNSVTGSSGAIIYHPIENERAKWLCSNATNGKGCFIGYTNIEYRNNRHFRWNIGASISPMQPTLVNY